jgi:hypothetical protein
MLVCAQWLDPDHELFDPDFALPYQTRVCRKEALWALPWVLAAAALFFFHHWIVGGFVLLYALFCVKSVWDEHRHLQAIRAAMRKGPRAA